MADKPLPKYFFVKLAIGAVCVVIVSLIVDCLFEHYIMPQYRHHCLLEYMRDAHKEGT